MNLQNLTWPAGRRNAAGISRILFCPCEDILTFPALGDPETATTYAELIEMEDLIVCKTGKKFIEIYCTLETGEVKSKMVGPRDGKGRENSVELSSPGNEAAFLGFDSYTDNLPGVFVVLEKNGKWRVVGSLNDPAYKDDSDGTSGKAGTDGRATKLMFKSLQETAPPIYKPVGGVASLLVAAA
ncbi:MAG: hypothetical protein H7Y13_11905 [Sphingobacteriaceae bacterium]|nr:hypothetical protein [Sphingobacteriaceae bacterium]